MKERRMLCVLLGLASLAFLATGCVDTNKTKQLESQIVLLNESVQQRDEIIRDLREKEGMKQKELDEARAAVASVRKEMDALQQEAAALKTAAEGVIEQLPPGTADAAPADAAPVAAEPPAAATPSAP